MKINRNNYEIYFLDYSENQLSPGEIADLMLFLEQNPDLKSEFEEFEILFLTPEENIIFEPKKSLKKHAVEEVKGINSENFEQYFVASIEKQLNAKEEAALNNFLQRNTSLAKEYELFKRTILIPDTSISFNNKSSLYRKTPFIYSKRFLYTVVSAAAVILLLFSIYLNLDLSKKNNNTIVKQDQPNTIIENNISKEIPQFEKRSSSSKSKINTATKSSIVKNSDSKKKSLISTKNTIKPPLVENNLTELKMIDPASVHLSSGVSGKIILEEREYIYDVFREYYVDDVQYAYQESEADESKSFLGFAFSKFTDLFRNHKTTGEQSGNITFWDIADAGITGFNKITQKDVQLNREYDSEGKLTSLALVSDGIEIYKRKNPKAHPVNN